MCPVVYMLVLVLGMLERNKVSIERYILDVPVYIYSIKKKINSVDVI